MNRSFIVFFLCMLPCLALGMSGSLGVAANVTGGAQVTLDFGYPLVGPQLVIELSDNAQVTLSAFVTLTKTLPSGYQSASFAAGAVVAVGFTLSVSPSNVTIVSANLSTPQLSLVSQTAISSSGMVGSCLQYDASINAYAALEAPSYTVDKTISVDLPGQGTYVFVLANVNATIPNYYNRARTLIRDQLILLSYPLGLTLQVNSSTSQTLTVTYNTSNPHSAPTGYIAYGAYWDFNASVNESVTALIAFEYNQTVCALKGIAADTLRIGFYDETSASWVFMNSGNSTSGSVVSQATSHFSTWGVYGQAAPSTSAGTTSQATSSGTTGSGTTGDASSTTDNVSTTGGAGFVQFSVLLVLAAMLFAF